MKVDLTIDIDVTKHESPCDLASRLESVSKGESVAIRLADVEVCPNRIVPVVGIVDDFVSRGYDIHFLTIPHSAGERAVSGFNNREFNPHGSVAEAFGRVWRFDNAGEQYAVVDAMVLQLDKSANLANGVRQCFDWCLNEVTDNVLNHSRPGGGAHGYVMAQFVRAANLLKICVFDTGIGIRKSFAGSKYEGVDAAEAIRLAVRRGVTNGNGQGNGLWGLHEMVKLGKYGKLHIRSGGAEYLFRPSDGIESVRGSEPLPGFDGTTTVDFQVVCTESTRLQDIFGEDFQTVDFWTEAHEDDAGALNIEVAELASGFGSRDAAAGIRLLVENAIDNDRRFVKLDFRNVVNCSSSFIDELLAKLVVKYGIVTYANVLKILNLTGLPAALANVAIAQRYDMEARRKDESV